MLRKDESGDRGGEQGIEHIKSAAWQKWLKFGGEIRRLIPLPSIKCWNEVGE